MGSAAAGRVARAEAAGPVLCFWGGGIDALARDGRDRRVGDETTASRAAELLTEGAGRYPSIA